MSYSEEFRTVDRVLTSGAETRVVDAFALSLIKAERQLRKLVTHLVYQFPCFRSGDGQALRQVLAKNNRVYFEGLERGFNELYPKSIESLFGSEYSKLKRRLTEAEKHRDKIFHGQLTSENLTRPQLLAYVEDIGRWCKVLAESALIEFRYDGFGRNSFQKSKVAHLWKRLKPGIKSIESYEEFIHKHMERRRGEH